ncbi:hypothetical protein BCR43DRAFT_493900 [Syncephalastrum racemosum]|uniref:Uncharacterized protein n=1 Tax=Syncephalastrum racemosum TaxID=13706 RepID=A0A1X2H730_SYNRA|nr:hypothetical protein BCR43DRAFT_493900 [Syncephalastrum racemosum]
MRLRSILQRSTPDQHHISPPILVDPHQYQTQPVYRIKANGAHVLQQPRRARPTSVPSDVDLDDYEPTLEHISYPRPVWASTDYVSRHSEAKQRARSIEPLLIQRPCITTVETDLLRSWLAKKGNHDQQLQLLFEEISQLSMQQSESTQLHERLIQRHQKLQIQLHQKNLHIAKLKQKLGR